MKYILPVFIFLFFVLDGKAQLYNADDLSADFFKGRRNALRELLPEKSMAVLFANPIRNRSNDVDFQFSQDPNFYYLTGIKDPDVVVFVFKEKQVFNGVLSDEIVFIRPKNPSEELWNGRRFSKEEIALSTGIKVVITTDQFADFDVNLSNLNKVFVKYPEQPNRDNNSMISLENLVSQFKTRLLAFENKLDTKQLDSYFEVLREVKQPEELVLLKKAVAITADGFLDMMRAVKPEMYEYQSQAIVEYFVRNQGGEYQGYLSICGSGNNGCVLHYDQNRKQLKNGDLQLVDIGGEYHGYTADITRTFPVNGKFSTEQKLIYQIVLDAQNEGIAVCKKGAAFRATHEATMKVVASGLMKLGIIKREEEAKVYFMHGTSHYLGLDVHDAGTRGALKPGTVITVEPGIYIPDGSACDKKWWGIGIRIEDDILITDDEPINLSVMIPREIKEIEELMQENSILKN
jgi:Xaa-Pro aminopeptidase